MMNYDPYSPRAPKKDGKPKGKLKPEELPAEVTRRAQGDADPMVSLRSPDGQEIGPVPMSEMKAAMRAARGERDDPASEMAGSESTAQTVAAGQLRSFIERIERVEAEMKECADDRKEVYAEAKGTGFDTKAIRAIVRLRKMDQADRQEQEAILDLYKAALGMA